MQGLATLALMRQAKKGGDAHEKGSLIYYGFSPIGSRISQVEFKITKEEL